MASLGLRPPQFSEDIAWLPAWLQPHQDILLDEHIKDAQTPSQQAYKDLVFLQGNTSDKKDVDLLTREDSRCNNFHLFLSGDESSPVGMTPSSGNLMNLHLHLSSDGITQQTPSSVCNILQTERHRSNNIMSMQSLPETSTLLDNKSCQYKIEVKDGQVNAPLPSKSRASLNFRSQSLSKDKKDSGVERQEKLDCRQLKNADLQDAVELSIAASEALAIIELVKNGSSSELLSASSVLEVALLVKQARNHLCSDELEKVFDCVTDEVDETGLLLELDEDTMANAFDDVGLSIAKVDSTHDLWCSSSVMKQGCNLSRTCFRVLDTPVSENRNGCDEVQNIDDRAKEVDFDGTYSKRKLEHLKNSQLELPGCVWQKKLCGDSHSALNTLSAERHLKPHSIQSVQTNSKVIGAIQDDEVSVHVDLNTAKCMPKFVIGETSLLSESPDVILDENSAVQKPEDGSKIASLSSVDYEGLCSIANKGITFSQDIVSSSILSLADPLCSVVPCSISSDTAEVTLGTKQKNIEETAKYLNPELEQGLENKHKRTKALCTEFTHGEGNIVTKINGEGSGVTSRRQLTSLKAYSMLLPSKDPVQGILGLLSSEKTIDCFTSCSEKIPTRHLFSKPTSKCSAVQDYEKDQKAFSVGKLITESTNHNKHNDETANDEAEFQDHQEERCSPLVLNNGIRHRLQASKIVLSKDIGEMNLKSALIPEMKKARDVVSSEDQRKIASLHSSRHPNPCEGQGSSKKRVRFSKAEIDKFQPSTSGQKIQSGSRARSITRTRKRLKESSLELNFGTLEMTTNLTNYHIMDRKIMIFQGLEFLLTGFLSQKKMELEMLIRKHGGFVLSDIPSPSPNLRGNRRSRCKLQQLPVVLSPKKLQTTKFLYGCAVNCFLLKVNWLTDSIVSGSTLPPEKYVILSNQDHMKYRRIGRPVRCDNHIYMFEKLGIMLHGKHSFCTKFAKIVKHGGGQVFKTLLWLVQSLKNGKISVGAIVAEDESRASRHLKHCAFEQKLPTLPVSWIINSLHSGKLLPFEDNHHGFPSPTIKIPEFPMAMELSEEI